MILKKKQFWGTIVAIALLAYCVKDVRLDEVKSLAREVDYLYLALATIASFLFFICKGLRWRIILSQQKQIPPIRAVLLFSAGQILNIMMPMLTGQVGRLFLFSRAEGIRKTVLFSTIILEVLFDAISLVVFLFVTSLAFAFPQEYRTVSLILVLITVAALIVLYTVLHWQLSLEELARKHFRDRAPGFYITMKKFLRSFNKGMILLRSSQHMIGSLAYSLLSWAVHTTVIFLLLKAFGLSLPFGAAAAIMILNTLAVMIPITPGNAGTFELAVSSSLIAFSVGRGDAVMFALVLHLLDLLPIVTMGLIFLHQDKVSIREIKSQHEEDIVFDQVSEEGVFVDDGV